MGSPKGAIFRTVTRVPGVSPISTSRRFTGPLSFPTARMTARSPGATSTRVPALCFTSVIGLITFHLLVSFNFLLWYYTASPHPLQGAEQIF